MMISNQVIPATARWLIEEEKTMDDDEYDTSRPARPVCAFISFVLRNDRIGELRDTSLRSKQFFSFISSSSSMIMQPSKFGRKLLFSDLSYKTNEQSLLNYFATYGSIEELCLEKDDQDQSVRKGFLTFTDTHSIDHLMSKRPHLIDDRFVHVQRFIPTQCINTNNISEYLGVNLAVNEVFINRLCSGETREMFMGYFQSFGHIVDCRVYHSSSMNFKQTGYAFLRFTDYDSVDRIILARPHRIHSKIYHLRKCIPRDYNYIVSSTKPLSQNKPNWRHFSTGLINLKTQEILYPSMPTLRYGHGTMAVSKCSSYHCSQLAPHAISVSTDAPHRNKTNSTNDFEIVPAHSISPSTISLVNSTDSFTPLASPLYSTAIAYSPTYDNVPIANMNNSYLLTMVDVYDKQHSYELI